MTPIKRGTARRLGLTVPIVPAPFSWDQFVVAMSEMARNVENWRPGGMVIGPGSTREGR